MTKSKIKINPVTMEIEIEVSDSFLEKYFQKLTNRFDKAGKVKPKIRSIKRKAKATPFAKRKKGSIQESILERIKMGNVDGTSVSEIQESTGLSKIQIYGVIKKLKSRGFIKTTGRGNYLLDRELGE